MIKKLENLLKSYYLCDHCLGRLFAQLLTGLTNEERGRIIRNFLAMLYEAGKIKILKENLYGVNLRKKVKIEKPVCFICKNFFEEKLDKVIERVLKVAKEYEFNTFLIGCKPTEEMLANEEKIWEIFGAEYAESIRSEINREIGKRLEKILEKKVDKKRPDITFIINLKNLAIQKNIKSLFVFGGYKKLVRGIPQAKWYCPKCKGKGCVYCKGKGKLYPTSVQEIIEKPLIKATKARKTRFHAEGREDIDAKCLDYRPFIIELVKPKKRKIDLKKIEREINKSKKVKVKGLKFVEKGLIKFLKNQKSEKTYEAIVTFRKKVDEEKLKKLKILEKIPIKQRTPLRVLHRRADKLRIKRVRKISWKVLSKRKVIFKIRCEAGTYVKELINGDRGRTLPSISEIIGNEPIKIELDVIKIHSPFKP